MILLHQNAEVCLRCFLCYMEILYYFHFLFFIHLFFFPTQRTNKMETTQENRKRQAWRRPVCSFLSLSLSFSPFFFNE